MTTPKLHASRRAFLGNSLKLRAGSLLLGWILPGQAAEKTSRPANNSKSLAALPDLPTRVLMAHEGNQLKTADRQVLADRGLLAEWYARLKFGRLPALEAAAGTALRLARRRGGQRQPRLVVFTSVRTAVHAIELKVSEGKLLPGDPKELIYIDLKPIREQEK